jgi:hypothetical protein
MIDALGDVGVTLAEAKPTALNRLYRELNVSAVYLPEERAVDVTARPRVDSARVRGELDTEMLHTRTMRVLVFTSSRSTSSRRPRPGARSGWPGSPEHAPNGRRDRGAHGPGVGYVSASGGFAVV